MVTHKINNVADADRIIVIDGGQKKECGTYDELVHQNGLFRLMCENQVSAGGAAR